jgi:predicted ATPase
VWTIDDVQWADPSTVEVVHFVARRSTAARIAILVAGRPDALPPEHAVMRLLTDLRREERAERVSLAPLAESDIAVLARAAGVPVERAAVIRSRSNGNAFFATELLAAMLRGDAALPETARDAILARVHSLPAPARTAIEGAAILGVPFRVGEVAGLMQLDTQTATAALGTLESRELLRAHAEGGEYEITHDLVREAVYSDLPSAVRVDLHRRAIEVVDGARGGDGAGLVCYHAELAGDADCAFACALTSGERALAAGGDVEAVASFDRALRQPGDPESRRRCLTLRAEAKRRLGLAEEAAADIAAAGAVR